MYVIEALNPDHALMRGLHFLKANGEVTTSRNGTVLVAPGPVMTVYRDPTNRVSTWVARDANPFFHLVEAMWMLLGREDVELVGYYASNMQMFSDNGTTLHGAYGHRWRNYFEHDQLEKIIFDLGRDSASRRAVLTMWDGSVAGDLDVAASGGKDVPCNTHAYFRVRNGELDMTVCCRSNDAVWGAHGANVVHFSMLQEYLASHIGVGVGVYYHLSNNYHVYSERPDVARLFEQLPDAADKFSLPKLKAHVPMDAREPRFLEEVQETLELSRRVPANEFCRRVLKPMVLAHRVHRAGATKAAIQLLEEAPSDWSTAGQAWLQRRTAP
jgi:hypothetical protein